MWPPLWRPWVVTVVITIYNTTSVVILEMFNSEGKTDVKTILVNVVKNPLLQGAMVGLVFFFLGIHVPKSLLTPIAAFADATSPVALFVLGGTLHFNAIRGNLKYLVPALSLKLLVLPAVMLALGYAFGLRDLELFLLVAIYGTPDGCRLLSHGPEHGRRRASWLASSWSSAPSSPLGPCLGGSSL